jgi:hypothetical protein
MDKNGKQISFNFYTSVNIVLKRQYLGSFGWRNIQHAIGPEKKPYKILMCEKI